MSFENNAQDVHPQSGNYEAETPASTRRIFWWLLGALFFMGFIGTQSSSIVTYHNDFFTNSFNEVFVTTWNNFIDTAKKENANDKDLVAYLKTTMRPALVNWQKIAEKTYVPSAAKKFHDQYTASMRNAVAKIDAIVKSQETGDDPEMKQLEQLIAIVQKVRDDATAFQKDLVENHNVTIQETKKT